MGSGTNWFSLPESLDNYPDKVKLRDGGILLRYSDDSLTMRVENADVSDLEEVRKLAENSDHAHLMMKLLSLVNEYDTITQIGSTVDIDEDVPERFEWDCGCCGENLFQLKGKYTGIHADCINCGKRASIIINECGNCSRESIFVKESANVDDWYECYRCGIEMNE